MQFGFSRERCNNNNNNDNACDDYPYLLLLLCVALGLLVGMLVCCSVVGGYC